MIHTSSPRRASTNGGRLLTELRDAQDEHDAIRRALRSGVSAGALAADHRRWEAIGQGIADLARLIGAQFAASAFGDARPDTALLTARLSESIDDLLDEPVWTVIDAAARTAAAEPR